MTVHIIFIIFILSQIATEKLHETYLSLRAAESKCINSGADATPEPYAADAFLAALREVNSTFEGNLFTLNLIRFY